MKRRGAAPVVMMRTADVRECPECHRQMRLARCPDHGCETRALTAELRKPIAI